MQLCTLSVRGFQRYKVFCDAKKLSFIFVRNCLTSDQGYVRNRYDTASTKTEKSAFSFSGEVSEDTLIYSYNNDRYYRNISIFSVVMGMCLIFQSYVTYFDFSKVKPKVPAATGELTRRKRFWLFVQRNQFTILAITYLITGILV